MKTIISYVKSIYSFSGEFLFLRPHESYFFNFQCPYILENPGRYTIKYSERQRRYFHKNVKIYDNKFGKSIILPIVPPKVLARYSRYDGSLKESVITFNIAK
jgi:hypothetical protein